MTFEASDRNSFKVQGGRVSATHVAFYLLFKVELQFFLQVFCDCQLIGLSLSPHTHAYKGGLTWTGSWPGSSEAAQHDVCRSRNDGDFSPAQENKPEHGFNELI